MEPLLIILIALVVLAVLVIVALRRSRRGRVLISKPPSSRRGSRSRGA